MSSRNPYTPDGTQPGPGGTDNSDAEIRAPQAKEEDIVRRFKDCLKKDTSEDNPRAGNPGRKSLWDKIRGFFGLS